jgi:hypothetical protein
MKILNSLIVLAFILTLISCNQKTKLAIHEIQFQNKTFSLYSESEKDTLIIEFQDSTCQIFGSSWEGKIPWRITNYDNTNFLVIDNKVIGIKNKVDVEFDCTFIDLRDNAFILKERNPKWNKELIYGTWMKKADIGKLEYAMNDSIKKPPLPPAPDGVSEKEFKYPGYYEIAKNSIKYYEYYLTQKSDLEINTTNEYLLMELGDDYINEKNWEWNIKSLSKSTMVVERNITTISTNTYVTDTLVRKKR